MANPTPLHEGGLPYYGEGTTGNNLSDLSESGRQLYMAEFGPGQTRRIVSPEMKADLRNVAMNSGRMQIPLRTLSEQGETFQVFDTMPDEQMEVLVPEGQGDDVRMVSKTIARPDARTDMQEAGEQELRKFVEAGRLQETCPNPAAPTTSQGVQVQTKVSTAVPLADLQEVTVRYQGMRLRVRAFAIHECGKLQVLVMPEGEQFPEFGSMVPFNLDGQDVEYIGSYKDNGRLHVIGICS